MTTTFVLHQSTTLIHSRSTPSECETVRDAQLFDASNWLISTIEEFGDYCYSEGYDTGYEIGYEIGYDAGDPGDY